jgi:BolA protein
MSGGSIEGQLPRDVRVDVIRERLEAALAPTRLEVIDDSHHHIGHEGARDGRGHYTVRIASQAFAGMTPLARHRAVYEALGTLMQTDIHALSIQATLPIDA